MIQKFAVLCLILLGVSFFPAIAQAQILGIEISGNLGTVCTGGVAPGDSLFANKPGDPFICASNASMFARFFCIIETTLGLVLGTAFCAIRDAWVAPFAAMMMLLMAVTGICFATGIVRFTVKDVSLLIFKMGLVTLFVTNAGVALDLAYGLYVGIMKNTVRLMMLGFTDLAATAGSAASAIENSVGLSGGGNAFTEADNKVDWLVKKVHEKASNVNPCTTLTFLGGLLLVVPFAAGIVFMALITYLGFFARAAYGYLYALIMVTFLIAAMPIFVSFALFKTTDDLFTHWLSYLGSNVIQIFIIFAIMGFAALVDLGAFIKELDLLIMPHTGNLSGGWLNIGEVTACSICEPNFTTEKGGGVPYDPTIHFGRPWLDTGAPCPTPKKALDWGKVMAHGVFFKYLALNGVALFIITMIMEEFMKMGPDMARMLGGAKLIHTITGASTMGARYHSVSSALHTGSVLFETGAKQRWRTDGQTSSDRGFLANTTVGRVFSATAGGFATAANGEHVMYGGGNQDENDTSYNQERRDLDRAKEQANTQVRTTIETYSDAKTKAESIQKLYRKGEATLDQVTVANQNLAKAHENAVKAKDIRDAQESDVKRDKAAGKEYKQGLRKLEKNPKSVGKSVIDSTLEEPGGG